MIALNMSPQKREEDLPSSEKFPACVSEHKGNYFCFNTLGSKDPGG